MALVEGAVDALHLPGRARRKAEQSRDTPVAYPNMHSMHNPTVNEKNIMREGNIS